MNKELTPNLCICAADLHSCNQTKFSEALFWHFKHLQHKPRFDRNIKFHSGTRNTSNFQSSCTLHLIWWWWTTTGGGAPCWWKFQENNCFFLQSDRFCLLILYIWESCEACSIATTLFCTVRWKEHLNLYIFCGSQCVLSKVRIILNFFINM